MFPHFSPQPKNIDLPYWSVMIPTYNSSTYLEETLLSVLQQDPGVKAMQIEIVDDCSPTRSSLETIKKLGIQDRVSYYRQPRNLGLAGNWNTCIERAKGEIVHIIHQDDIVYPGFYQSMEVAFKQNPSIGAAFCCHQFMDNDGNVLFSSVEERSTPGILENWLEKITSTQRILAPSITVRRSVYEKLDGFNPSLTYVLDWEMWIRISHSFPVYFVPDILAAYRGHDNSESARLRQTAQTIRELPTFFLIRNQYLPKEIARKSEEIARSFSARYTIGDGISFLKNHQFRRGFLNIYEALRCDFKPATIMYLLQMMEYFLLMRFRGFVGRLLNKPDTTNSNQEDG